MTAVLSSASLFETVEVDDDAELFSDAGLFSSELELDDCVSTVAFASDAADELELSAAEVCDAVLPAEDPPEPDAPEPDEEPPDDWPESSAKATLT